MTAFQKLDTLCAEVENHVAAITSERAALKAQLGNPDESLTPEQAAAVIARLESIKTALEAAVQS